MPKLKTSKGVRKRMRVTKKGKIKHFKASRSHLLTSKRSKRKRLLGRAEYLVKGDRKVIELLLPYGA